MIMYFGYVDSRSLARKTAQKETRSDRIVEFSDSGSLLSAQLMLIMKRLMLSRARQASSFTDLICMVATFSRKFLAYSKAQKLK